MKGFFPLLLLFVLPTLAPAADFDAKAIDALAEQALKDFGAPGLAVAIVKDDKVLLAKGYGVRVAGGDKSVTADTLFAIASCTKAFTAASVAALIDDKKLAWDDKVSKHLPSFHLADPLADREVTLRDCLCHRCGLSRHDVLWIQAPQPRELIVARIGKLAPTTSFRSKWEYNNAMFVVSGQAVGAASGGTWEEVIRQRIFTPLGMKSACFDVASAEKRDHARPHRRTDGGSAIESFPWDDIRHIGPAGAINANVNELSAWLRVQLNEGKLGDKRIFPASAVKEMHSPQMIVRNEGYWTIFFPPDVTDYLSYGLGWFVHDYRGQHCISHGGTLEGFRAQTVLAPKQKLGVIVLTNLGGCRLPEALSKNIIDAIVGLPTRDWNKHFLAVEKKSRLEEEEKKAKRKAERKPDTKPSLKPADYAGGFTAPGYGEVTVTAKGDALVLEWNGFALKLEHFHFDTFTFPEPYKGWPDDRVTFHLGADAKVEKISFLGRAFVKK